MTVNDKIFIYVLLGSQYCAKILAALDSAKIQYEMVIVPLDATKRSKELPSGGHKVPEMKVEVAGEKGNQVEIVPDSECILQWFDDHRGTHFFPDASARELSTRAGDRVLAGCAQYYNWIDQEGNTRSFQKLIKEKFLPRWIPFKGTVANIATKSDKKKIRGEVIKMLQVTEDQLEDESFVRNLLVKELLFFQSFLKSPHQKYLLGSEPCAVDFSVYAMLERLVGTTGDASLFPSFPDLLDCKELNELRRWYDGMQRQHPIVFHREGL